MPTRVGVVGAGPMGLMAMKNLKEDGFDVTGYETRSYVGGLWKPSTDSSLSAAECTIFNSSRFRSAASDFPFSDDVDDFPSAQQMYQYLDSYADHFGLKEHIHLNARVKRAKRDGTKWVLELEMTSSSGTITTRSDRFDKLLIATGSFVTPKIPLIEGIGTFNGPCLHAIRFHDPSQYKGKTVLLIGLHATTQDVASGLERHASKVYISHRSGLVMLPRYGPDGATFDQTQTLNLTFAICAMSNWIPNVMNYLFDKFLLSMSAKAFPNIPKSWGFSPAPSISVTPPLIADQIYPLLASGFAEPVPHVRKVTGPKSVELTNDRVLEDIDAIIYCTGYDFAVPFTLDEFDAYPVPGEPPNLYRGLIPLHPDPKIRESLALLGHGSITFPGFFQLESQGMAVSQLWQGKSKFPSLEEMKLWHKGWLKWRNDLTARQKITSTFYTAFLPLGDHLRWLDETAGTGLFANFGWFSSRAWNFWWKDKELYRKCLGGLFSPTIWRLFDMGKRKPMDWDKARAQIFAENERAQRQIRERLASMKKEV